MCKHYNLKITGKVQGVWCRKYIFEKAKEWNIRGIVKNMDDGSVWVEIETEEPQKVEKFLQWLYECSPLSDVKKVEIMNNTDCIGLEDFKILK